MSLNSDESRRKASESRFKGQIDAMNPTKLVSESLIDLPADQQAKIAARCVQMPPRHRRTYIRAMTGRSLKAAVRAQCWECMGWETHPEGCSAPACPLYQYRPGA